MIIFNNYTEAQAFTYQPGGFNGSVLWRTKAGLVKVSTFDPYLTMHQTLETAHRKAELHRLAETGGPLPAWLREQARREKEYVDNVVDL